MDQPPMPDSSGPGGTLYQESITSRDGLGRITGRSETIGGVTTSYAYTYDPAGRIDQVFVNGPLAFDYDFDANGNPLGATVDAQDRLLALGGFTYGYTDNGELATKTETATSDVTSYDYDALGNLLQVVLPGTPSETITYVVDGRNRRIGKKRNGVLEQGFLYKDPLNPVAELDGSGNLVSRFVYASRSHVPDYMVKGGKTYRLIHDHLGSVRLVVDATTGTVAQRIDYDPFGNPTFVVGSPDFQPFGFAGGLYDPDTGLVRFGARDYDPQTGRWTAKDPIEFLAGDTNLFGYAFSDPVNLIDPNGFVVGTLLRPLLRYGGQTAAEAAVAGKGLDAAVGFGNSLAGASGSGADLGPPLAAALGLPDCPSSGDAVNAGVDAFGAAGAYGLAKGAIPSAVAGGTAATAFAVAASAAVGFQAGSAIRSGIKSATGVDIGTAPADALSRRLYGF